MSEQASLTGQCLCGAVRITVTQPAGWLGVCHCGICQQWSGGLWAGFPARADTVTVTGPVATYASSPIAHRGFCGTCGTQLWMRDVAKGADYDLMPGIFHAARDWPLKSEIYHDQAFAAYPLSGTHKRADAQTYRAKNPQVDGVPHG